MSRTRSLNQFLTTLILAIALPGLLFGVAASWWIATELQNRHEQEAARLAKAAAEDVSDTVRLTIAALKALARSPSIVSGDDSTAYRFASQLATDLGQDIGLATADGTQIFNTRRPLGEPLPRRSDPRSYGRALATGLPSVSNVIIGAVARRPLVTFDIPVVTPHGTRVLATSTELTEIAAILKRTEMSPGWLSAVLDGEGRVLARSVRHDEFVGRAASPEAVAAASSGELSGRFESTSLDGVPVVNYFHHVDGTDWSVMVAIPRTVLWAPLRRQYAALVGAGLVALLLTTVVAVILGRRLRSASMRLTEAAAAVGADRELSAHPIDLAEFEAVASTLRRARAEIRERETRLERLMDERERYLCLLQESEERLRLFTEIVPAGIAMFDIDMRYIAASRRYAEDYRGGVGDLVGRSHYEVFPEIPERWKEIHRRCLAGATESCSDDPFPRADGTMDWVSWEIRPWHDTEGKVGGLVLASEVVSDRKRAADELRRAKTEAEQANQAKSRFLAAASHDLRQPVQSLLLLLEVLRGRAGEGPLAQLTDAMEKALEALSTLLNSILDISKLEAGVVVPRFETVELAPVLQRLAEEYAARGAERGIAVRLARGTAVVDSDPALLERVLRNLLENALRYTERGRVVIGIRRRAGMVRIDVIDTGIGIAAQDLQVIFDEFHQLGNPARDRSQGLGLGLAIVQRTVRLLGGRVEVASNPGRGSRFSVLLPMGGDASPATGEGRPAATGEGERILVVEDDPTLLEAMLLMLGDKGYRPQGVASGEEAVALVSGGLDPAAVIADYRMAGHLDGIGAITELRRLLGHAVPALLVTGDTAPERMREVHVAGIALLHKPITSQVLLQRLAEILA